MLGFNSVRSEGRFIPSFVFAVLICCLCHVSALSPSTGGFRSMYVRNAILCKDQNQGRVPSAILMKIDDDGTDLTAASVEKRTSSMSSPLDRPTLAIFDVIALFGFAAVGKASHASDGSYDLGAIASTAFPFVASWLATSPLTGVYAIDRSSTEGFLRTEITTVAKGWVVAVPIGIALRSIIKGYAPPLPFVIVTMVSTLIILATVRVIFAVMEDFFVELVN